MSFNIGNYIGTDYGFLRRSIADFVDLSGVFRISEVAAFKSVRSWPVVNTFNNAYLGIQSFAASSTNSTSAVGPSPSHTYLFEFYYQSKGIAMIRNCTAPDVSSIIGKYSGPGTPAPLAPNVSDFQQYKLYRLDEPAGPDTGHVFSLDPYAPSNWSFAIVGIGTSHGYAKSVRANNPNNGWADLSTNGQYTYFRNRVFSRGGVGALMRGNYPSLPNSDPVRPDVVMMTGAGEPSGGTGGGPAGGNGLFFTGGCANAGPGRGGQQTGPTPGVGGNPGSPPANGFAGGPGGGYGGAGFDGWYGGSGGSSDTGACFGYGTGGGGSGRLNSSYADVSDGKSYFFNYGAGITTAAQDWWWISNFSIPAEGGVFVGIITSPPT